jgi:hypothetical protein
MIKDQVVFWSRRITAMKEVKNRLIIFLKNNKIYRHIKLMDNLLIKSSKKALINYMENKMIK